MLGGEQSGHIIFSKYATTGDGLITAIKLMQVMLDRKLPLSELTVGLEVYPQVLKNVKVADKDEALADPDVTAAVENVIGHLSTVNCQLSCPANDLPIQPILRRGSGASSACGPDTSG